ncbi:MAG TPA: hypothetical protein VF592_12890 [Sphingomonas sp.]|jgi:hypothetical protein|uniref:hypothetical protein n=1 Tax=Sphingomonas sp. TaxID=28214 RepID=UPI002ED9EE53
MSGGQWMVVLIVLIGVVGGIIKNRHRQERRGRVGTDDAETLRLRDEVRQMKDRIQVLERVITDNHGSLGLDREIERLRDR